MTRPICRLLSQSQISCMYSSISLQKTSTRKFSQAPALRQAGPETILPSSSHRAWNPEDSVILRMQDTGPQAREPLSVPGLLRYQVEQLPGQRALWCRGRAGQDVTWTWSQYYQEIRDAAKGLIELGLDPFHSVAIIGHNDPAYHISHLAAIHAGGFATGVYQTNNAEACQYIMEDSRTNIAVVGDREQLAKVLSVRPSLPALRAVLMYGEEELTQQEREAGVLSWSELVALGKDTLDTGLDTRLSNIAINQCCMLCYTSGTTGNPKGTMLSHDSVTYAARQNTDFLRWQYGTESVLSYLPMNHIAGTMMDIYLIMAKGGVCCFADKNALKGTLIENLKYYRPTKLMGVPRVFEKIEEGMKTNAAKGGIKKLLGDWAKSQSLAHHAAEEGGSAHTSLGYRLAQRIVLNRVHTALGLDRCKDNMLIGGSAVSPETVKYFLSLDMKVLEIISSTESCAMAQIINTDIPGGFRIGKVGRVYNDQMEVKLLDRDATGTGELLVRGRGNCMGYLNNREKTLETLDDDGWLHSGDLVREESDGFHTVVGRIKEIVIPSGGENIAPTNIEDEIKRELEEIVSNAMVVGDRKKYITCLLTLRVTVDPVTLAPTNILDSRATAWLKDQVGDISSYSTVEALLSSPVWSQVESSLQAGVDRANNKAVSNVAKVKKWKVLPREFSVDGGELGPTLKLKRFHVLEMYRDLIDRMYEEEH